MKKKEFVDLSGIKFNRLLVLGVNHLSKKYGYYWDCECECGNKTIVQERELVKGLTKSCGCLKIEKAKEQLVSLVGKKFGRLTVIERIENYNKNCNDRSTYWLCKCECGNETTVRGSSLKNGMTTSCGCYNLEKISEFEDLTGRRFGRLTVIKRVERPEGKATSLFWLCKCDCGNEKIINGQSLKKSTKSCGCLAKETTSAIFSKGDSVATFNILINRYKREARNRNLSFELNKEEFRYLTKQNCYYCDKEPEKVIKSLYNKGDYIFNGIDRINPLKGYFFENCVPCCSRCNEGKWDCQLDDFALWIEKVYKNFIEKGILGNEI